MFYLKALGTGALSAMGATALYLAIKLGWSIRASTTTSFLVLVGGSIVALYGLHLRPSTRRQWVYIAITIGFLAWILPLMVALR
jgi:hypothetical protein